MYNLVETDAKPVKYFCPFHKIQGFNAEYLEDDKEDSLILDLHKEDYSLNRAVKYCCR